MIDQEKLVDLECKVALLEAKEILKRQHPVCHFYGEVARRAPELFRGWALRHLCDDCLKHFEF